MKYIVYVTVNLCNGKLYFGVHRTNPNIFDGYIGCGIYRMSQAKESYAFHKAVKKYGYENFRRIIISIFPDNESGKKAAYLLEKQIVTSTLLKSKYIYNIVKGGSGDVNDKIKRRIYQFDMNGNYLRSYKSVRDAANVYSRNNIESGRSNIKNCCYGITRSAFGYYWSYEKVFRQQELNENDTPKAKYRHKVAQYALDGRFIACFDSVSIAQKELGLADLYNAINHHGSLGGYQFRYYDGNSNNIPPFESSVTKYRTKPVILIDPNGNKFEYKSMKECIKLNPKLKRKGLQDVINGVHKTHFGYICKYKDEDIV